MSRSARGSGAIRVGGRWATGHLEAPAEDALGVGGDRVQSVNLQDRFRRVHRDGQGRVHRHAERAMVIGYWAVVVLALFERRRFGVVMSDLYGAHHADHQNAEKGHQPQPCRPPITLSGLEEGLHGVSDASFCVTYLTEGAKRLKPNRR